MRQQVCDKAGCIDDGFGNCRAQWHRENPRRVRVLRSVHDTGMWIAQIMDADETFRCKVKFSLPEAYVAALELTEQYGEAA